MENKLRMRGTKGFHTRISGWEGLIVQKVLGGRKGKMDHFHKRRDQGAGIECK